MENTMEINTARPAVAGKRNFESIDLMKFICAILVVAIHLLPLGRPDNPLGVWCSRILRMHVARIAVPFFFMATGFLVFRKTDRSSFTLGNTLPYIRKVYRLYLLWTLIYGAFILRNILACEQGVVYGVMLFFRNLIFTGSYSQLWYLNASAFAVLLLSVLLHRRVRFSRILLGSFLLYLVGLIFQPYYGALDPLRQNPVIGKLLRLFDLVIVTPRNGLFEGFFFVSLGALFAYRPVEMRMRTAVLGFAASMALMLAEALLLTEIGWSKGYDMYFFLAPSAFFLFYILLHVELKPRGVYRDLRISSSLIFFVHGLFAGILTLICARFGIETERTWTQFLLTLLLSLLFSAAVIKLSDHSKFKWLKKLYS